MNALQPLVVKKYYRKILLFFADFVQPFWIPSWHNSNQENLGELEISSFSHVGENELLQNGEIQIILFSYN